MQETAQTFANATYNAVKYTNLCIVGQIIALFVMLTAMSSCTVSNDEKLPADIISVGSQLPQFTVIQNDGRTFTTTSKADSALVLIFFNTECKDCQRELPIVQRIYNEMHDSVRFLCISRAEADSSVSAYWKKNAFNMPYSAQPDRGVYSLFANRTIPRIYISDTLGTVRAMFVEKAGYEDLHKAVEAVMPIR